MNFYYQYDKDAHKAKFVIRHTQNEGEKVFLADRIVCSVKTETIRQDTPPKFVVSGACTGATLDLLTDTIYIE